MNGATDSTKTVHKEGRSSTGSEGADRSKVPCLLDPIWKCPIFGISQVMSQIQGASVLVHGPKGCAFPAYEATLYDRLAFNFSEMCERTVIFGGEEKLRDKLHDTYYESFPTLISVVTTCSSEIIGDDVLGVVRESGLSIPVLKMEGVGFKRGHRQGVEHAMLQLIAHCCADAKPDLATRDESINLLCHVGTSVRWKDEAYALEKQLAALGRPVRRLFCDNTLSDFGGMERADLTVLVSADVGQEAAAHLERRFGVPFIAPGLPVGLEQTVRWVGAVAGRLNLQSSERLDREADAIRGSFREGLGRLTTFRPLDALRSLSTVIISEPDATLAYHHFLRRELGIRPKLVLFKPQLVGSTDLRAHRDAYPETEFAELTNYADLRGIVGKITPELILCNDVEYLLVRAFSDPLYVNISYPGARKVKLTSRPYLGFGGTLHFAEDLLNALIERSYPSPERARGRRPVAPEHPANPLDFK